ESGHIGNRFAQAIHQVLIKHPQDYADIRGKPPDHQRARYVQEVIAGCDDDPANFPNTGLMKYRFLATISADEAHTLQSGVTRNGPPHPRPRPPRRRCGGSRGRASRRGRGRRVGPVLAKWSPTEDESPSANAATNAAGPVTIYRIREPLPRYAVSNSEPAC